jgi:ABC-type branched-subunit amino acid transport system substrate-binding protein
VTAPAARPREPAGRRAGAALTAALAAAGLWHAGSTTAAPSGRTPLVATREQADSLAASRPSSAQLKPLAEWAKRAPLGELVWVLRRPPGELGSAELPLLDAALAGTPTGRASLRQRLLARRALAAPRPQKKGEPPPPDLAPLRPYASVFRVAALFPDAGEYAAYGRALRAALAAGLAWGRPAGAPALELDTLGTGDSDPARVAAALEQVAARADVVVGELLSVPTLSLATGTRLAGLVLVSPTATDERIGRVGPLVFQVGPGAEARARALAEVVLGSKPHPVAIAGSAAGVRGAFADAFAREVEARGGRVVRRDTAPGAAGEAAQLAVSLKSSGAEVLLWDGPGRDAETLVRALATAGAALRVCGGPGLAPDGMRAGARPLLEGVTWVDDNWRLPATVRARLDSLANATGTRPGSLWTRGYLAGRQIAAAVDAGALTAAEVAARWRPASDTSGAGSTGFLDPATTGATFATFVVHNGRSVDAHQ